VILVGCAAAGLVGLAAVAAVRLRSGNLAPAAIDRAGRENWRMPPLTLLRRPPVPLGRKIGLTILRSYLAVATVLVAVKIVQLAVAH
jgi:hypothetical protein